MDLLLHPETRRQLEAYLERPAHALLLEGEPGSGKGAVRALRVSQALDLPPEKLSTHAYVLKVTPDGTSISIETIRAVQDFIKLKTAGQNIFRRAIIIEDAQTMTIEAQNAFLKLLEEPPADTLIVLTAPPNQTLLPTIYSRVQRIQLKTLDKDELVGHFQKQGKDSPETEKAYYVSGGQIGLMSALLEDDAEHALAVQINQAKALLAMPVYERLAVADAIAKNKEQLPELLLAMQRVYHAVLAQAAEKDQTEQIRKSHRALKHIAWAQTQLRHNPNTKLLVSDLLLNL